MSKRVRNILLTGLVIAALATFGHRMYLLEYAPEDVKLVCAHEPVDIFLKYQYSRCLERNWHD